MRARHLSRPVFVIALITLALALFTLRAMATATIDFPPRQCLTCASSGNACDGGFPVCEFI